MSRSRKNRRRRISSPDEYWMQINSKLTFLLKSPNRWSMYVYSKSFAPRLRVGKTRVIKKGRDYAQYTRFRVCIPFSPSFPIKPFLFSQREERRAWATTDRPRCFSFSFINHILFPHRSVFRQRIANSNYENESATLLFRYNIYWPFRNNRHIFAQKVRTEIPFFFFPS